MDTVLRVIAPECGVSGSPHAMTMTRLPFVRDPYE